MNYSNYLAATWDKDPHPYVQQVSFQLPDKARVLDLGSGAGVDVEFLARHGFHVTAVDREDESCKMTEERCRGLDVETINASFEDLQFPAANFDLIVSIRGLPFIDPEYVKPIFQKISEWLRPTGQLVLSFFGPDDDWVKNGRACAWEFEEVAQWTSTEVVMKRERQHDAPPAGGGTEKHWHIRDAVLKRS